MISNSRIYVFNIKYKNKTWISHRDADELSGLIANFIKLSFTDLKVKVIKVINTYKNGIYGSELHMNKINYRGRTVLSKRTMSDLRKQLRKYFKKINEFEYEQVHIVNDEFSTQPTVGFLIKDGLHV